MANNKTEVRRILDAVKAEGRTSLTAPEGKRVCDAYGIAPPTEGVATTAADAPSENWLALPAEITPPGVAGRIVDTPS